MFTIEEAVSGSTPQGLNSFSFPQRSSLLKVWKPRLWGNCTPESHKKDSSHYGKINFISIKIVIMSLIIHHFHPTWLQMTSNWYKIESLLTGAMCYEVERRPSREAACTVLSYSGYHKGQLSKTRSLALGFYFRSCPPTKCPSLVPNFSVCTFLFLPCPTPSKPKWIFPSLAQHEDGDRMKPQTPAPTYTQLLAASISFCVTVDKFLAFSRLFLYTENKSKHGTI